MLPGFSASSSLYRSRQLYGGSATPPATDVTQMAGTAVIEPANNPCAPEKYQACLNGHQPPLACSFAYGECIDGHVCHPGVGCVSLPCAETLCVQGQECCVEGEICCNGSCTNFDTDFKNCGLCGNYCDAGETCCSGACKNLESDHHNCGSCGTCLPVWTYLLQRHLPSSSRPFPRLEQLLASPKKLREH